MVNSSYLVWNGDKIKRRLDTAAEAAINEATDEGAALMSQYTTETFKRRTGAAADSCEARPAQKRGGSWQGEWGSYGVHYYRFLNDGTIYIAPGHMLQRSADVVLPTLNARFATKGAL